MTILEKSQRLLKASAALEKLNSKSYPAEEILGALRFIKNSVIGNPSRKRFYLMTLNIAPRLVECLIEFKNDPALMGEIAPIIGSLAQLDVSALVAAGVMIHLFESLSSFDSRVVEASARALRQIVQHPESLRNLLITPAHIHHLVELSKPPRTSQASTKTSMQIAEVAVSILARLADNRQEMERLSEAGSISIMVDWLSDDWLLYPRVQEAALDALSSMCKSSGHLACTIASYKVQSGASVVISLFKMLQDRRPSMRLGACTCLSYLYNNSALPTECEPLVPQQLLPAIIRLFDDLTNISSQLGIYITTIQERAIYLFSCLVEKDPKLQATTLEGDAITKLSRVLLDLEHPKEGGGLDPLLQASTEVLVNPEKLRESTLLALAAVSSQTEESRRQIIELKLVSIIVSGLESPSPAIRIASCKCTRSLSRSIKTLRTSLLDGGIAQPLYNLLFDSDINVQIIASAAICNVVLDFSPMKRIIIERGGVEQLVKLFGSENSELRLNAAWALKNLLFQADLEMKKGVMANLGWSKLKMIINDEDLEIQIQALNLLRNLASSKIEDIEFVYNGMGSQSLLDIIEEKLSNPRSPIPVLNHTIYTVVNIAIGAIKHKDLIMTSKNVLLSIVQLMNHENEQIRIGAIWSIINLSWPEDRGADHRVETLKSMGVQVILNESSLNDPSMDVRDRARTALANLNSESIEDEMAVAD